MKSAWRYLFTIATIFATVSLAHANSALAETPYLFKGRVIFQGKPIAGAEVTFLNPSGGFLGVYTNSDSQGEFTLPFKEPGTGSISIFVPSNGRPSFAIANFLVRITSDGTISDVLYDSPPSNEKVAKIDGVFQLELTKPTLLLRVMNSGVPVDSPTLEPNGWGIWSYLRGNKDGYVALYVKPCLEKCYNYGFFYLEYAEGLSNVVQTANGFAARINYLGVAEVKDQLGKSVLAVDGVFNLNLLSKKQMPNGSLNLGIFPPTTGPEIKNFIASSKLLSQQDNLKISFQIESSRSLENLAKPNAVMASLRDKAKTLGVQIPLTRAGQDPYSAAWNGEVAIPKNFPDGEYEIVVSYVFYSSPIEETYKDVINVKTKSSAADTSNIKPPSPNISPKSITITCTKGKVSKKVTGINPKCPTGYVKK